MDKKNSSKSLRVAFIRVSSVNDTDVGIVKYTIDDIHDIITKWCSSSEFEYFYIQHDGDDDDINIHYHIVIRFYRNPMPFDNIKVNFPYGKIENGKNSKRCIQYLIHLNDKSKKQYEWSNVITNCNDLTPYKTLSRSQGDIQVQYYIDKIEKGEIREYNVYEMIPIDIWARNKSVINNSLTYYRERIFMDKERDIRVIFMSGDTGTYKSTFAKRYCAAMKKSYCVSSTSNDLMQDYKGEDVIIFDDLRDSDLKFNDLLKLLDNHTKSTVTSRYYNKGFIGDTIIITSFKELKSWYINIDDENKHQLYRRIGEMYKFNKNRIVSVYNYDLDKKSYILVNQFKNNITFEKKVKANLIDEMAQLMGDDIEIINENNSMLFLSDDVEFVQVDLSDEDIPFNL